MDYKCGVDTLDSWYTLPPAIVKPWPFAVFCNMMNMSAYNAFVIFVEINPKWNICKKQYRRRLFLKEVGLFMSKIQKCQSDLKNTKVRRRYRYLLKVDLVDANLLEATKSEGEEDFQNKGYYDSFYSRI